MYRILKDGAVLETAASPAWVVPQNNGSFALCETDEAWGVVVGGTVYHIAGKPEMEGAETVFLSEISESAYQMEQQARQDEQRLQTETALAELSILLANGLTGV